MNAVTGVIDALRTHTIVTIPDWHGDPQLLAFTLAVLRDPRLPSVVNDIVIENGNARHQGVMDRYVRGQEVPYSDLRRIWEDTTQAQIHSPRDGTIPEMYRAVRQVNAKLPPARQLRVLLGDPPIDWATVNSRDDHQKWLELRDSFPAALIQTEVLARKRRALVIYGQMHSQRRQVLSNYSTDDPRMHTIVSILMAVTSEPILTIWHQRSLEQMEPSATSWPVPGLLLLRDSPLGTVDFATYEPVPTRFSVQGGQIVPITREQWKTVPMREQFDALLYLGPRQPAPDSPPSSRICEDAVYLRERLRRMSVGAPPQERERLLKLCPNASRN